MLMLLLGVLIAVVSYWIGFWFGYLNRDAVTRFLRTGKFSWK